jgi:hypothetical protein
MASSVKTVRSRGCFKRRMLPRRSGLHIILIYRMYSFGAWAGVVVKALRYLSEGLGIDPRWCRWGFFPKLPTEPCALESTQPLNMSTRKTPGGEGGRCVKMTTLQPSSCRKSRRSRSLNLLEPQEPFQACSGNLKKCTHFYQRLGQSIKMYVRDMIRWRWK